MHAAKWPPRFQVMFVDQVFETHLIEDDLMGHAHILKDLSEHFAVWIAGADLVLDPAEKRLVHQLVGIEIRRENQKLVKWDFELPPGFQTEKVDAHFQRNNPAIQQLRRAHLLP